MLPGFLPSHASTLAAANVALGQWSRAWDLVIRAWLYYGSSFTTVERYIPPKCVKLLFYPP
jgi:hypothetical protein